MSLTDPPHWRPWIAGLGCLWIVGSPLMEHELGVRTPFTPSWNMYRGAYKEVCLVEFHTRMDDVDVRVDRLGVLGFERWNHAPLGIRRLKDIDAVRAQGRQICEALGPGTDLRVDARCGRYQGWKTMAARQRNLCLGPK